MKTHSPAVTACTNLPIKLPINKIVCLQGSSINWMMLNFMGADEFSTGLENYIAKHKYGNAEMVDLFDALNPVSNPSSASL